MGKKNDSTIVAGAGFIADFFMKLRADVIDLGGSDADLFALNKGDGRATIRKMAKLVIGTPVRPTSCLIDCDAAPFVPDGWTVEEHKKGGQLEFSPASVRLFFAEKQKKGVIVGHDLRKELEGKPVLNANVLDWLLAHPELIPEEWKGKAVFFWGTIYRDRGGRLYVRYLHWDGDGWSWSHRWLDDGWDSDGPAVLRAS